MPPLPLSLSRTDVFAAMPPMRHFAERADAAAAATRVDAAER